MSDANDRGLEISPDCPACGRGNTHPKDKLQRDYSHAEANAFCKNCHTEFYVPILWFNKDDWEENVETFTPE